MNLLLISSSYLAAGDYLEHCRDEVRRLLDASPSGHILFVPYAKYDLDDYARTAKDFFTKLDSNLGDAFISLHQVSNPREIVESSDVKIIFIGGGNTFRLLKALQGNDLLGPIRQKVRLGAGYMGTSAGSNMACPTIMTTNDMPIVEPQGFEALGLVDFQINPHFISGALAADYRGETREQRIAEYHQENDRPVIGLSEASWIRVNEESVTLHGANAMVFEKGQAAREWTAESKLPLSI